MAKIGPRWRVQFRRKREGKTDYKERLRLLRSGKPRFVVRSSLKHITVQVIQAQAAGDFTIAAAHSKELRKLGWKGHTSNTPSAYLVGLLCGYRAIEAGVKECVLDLGMHVPTPQSKVFAALKGALDSGLQISHDEKILPSEKRIVGEHIASYAKMLKEEDEKTYALRFSEYLKSGLIPENLQMHFNEVKQAIISKYGVKDG